MVKKLSAIQKKEQAKKEALTLFNKRIRNDQSFKKQTKIDRIELAKYKKEKEPMRYFYDVEAKQILKLNIRNENIKTYTQVFRNWGIARLPVKKIIEAEPSFVKDAQLAIMRNTDLLYETNAQVKLILKLTYEIRVSDYTVIRKKTIFWNGEASIYKINNLITGVERRFNYGGNENINNLISFITQYSDFYLQPFGLNEGDIPNTNDKDILCGYRDYVIAQAIKDIEIVSDLQRGGTYDIDPQNMRMREEKPLNISYLYNDIIELKESNDNCVKQYLLQIYERISEKKINKLGNEDGINCNELNKFCNSYNIKMLIYDIQGNIISSNYPEKLNKSYKSLVGISYNNHFYPVKNQILNKVSIPKKIKQKNDLNKSFDKLLKNNVIPSNIKIMIKDVKEPVDEDENAFVKKQVIEFITFSDDKAQYVNNPDYDICLEILNVFGLKDKITPFTNLKNLFNILEKPYKSENVDSFFDIPYTKGGFNYYNHDVDINKYFDKIITLDHGKFYSKMLCDLEYIISVDVRQSQPIKYDMKINDSVIEHYLYIAKPKKSSLLMENTNIYSGSHLVECYERGVEFDILEEIPTNRHFNYYTQLINDIYDKLTDKKYTKYMIEGKEQDLRKYIINIIIGKFEQDIQLNDELIVEKICNFQERMKEHGYYVKYDKYFLKVEKNKVWNKLYNKRPIAIQIKDKARVVLFDKIQELKIKEKDLVNIETDSISFVYKNQNLDFLNTNNWYGWKLINKDKKYFDGRSNCDFEIVDIDNSFFYQEKENNNNVLYNCYAGSGKTHTIIHYIIPKIEETNDKYIIITPSHNSAKEYYILKLNCKVVQTYKFINTLPEEKHIIIDEVGLCDRDAQDFIYKCYLDNKTIYSLGDFKQLLPIGENRHFDAMNYLNQIYGKIISVNTNFRNNFTLEYYDKLMYSTDKQFLINEIKKYRCNDYKKADIIICITNESRQKYNSLMAQHKKITKFDVGAKLICNTNNLRKKDIYNSFDFITTDEVEYEETGHLYVLDDLPFNITEKELDDNFELGYAITLYKAQGQQYKSFYFPDEDLKYINGRSVYTLISRLKEDLNDETKERNNKILEACKPKEDKPKEVKEKTNEPNKMTSGERKKIRDKVIKDAIKERDEQYKSGRKITKEKRQNRINQEQHKMIEGYKSNFVIDFNN